MEQDVKISRERFDHKDTERLIFKAQEGLNEEIVKELSRQKDEPQWMRDFRLEALQIFNETPTPKWGPDLSKLDLNKIIYFLRPDAKKNADSWEDVPEEIRKTFERLGIPEAERKSLAGAGAQYESDVVYHNLKKQWEDKGVIFEDCDIAIKKHPKLFKEHFMTKCVPVRLHKFTALHAAVWSGGTFLYIPPDVKVDMPLQAYFRMNAIKAGQFEHTLIIGEEGSNAQYIEGCFTKGANILTNPGYKPIEDVQVGDKVLTHTGEYKKVYHTQVRPYTGYLYNIKIFGDPTADIEVTEEHPFLAVKRLKERDRNKKWERRWLPPKELNKLDYLSIPINKVVVSNNSRTFEVKKRGKLIKKEVPITKEFCRIVGYYLAEGSIMKDSYLSFSFGSHEIGYIQDIKSLLKKVFGIEKFNEVKHKKNHGTSIVVGSVELACIFKEFGTACEIKGLPQWLMIEDPEKQKELIVGLFRGDGNYYSKKHKSGFKEVFRINTTSETLARQTREVLFRLRIPAFVNRRDREKPRIPLYTIGITGEYVKPFGDIVGISADSKLNNKNRASMFFADEDYIYVPIKSINKKIVSNKPVYNFGVEGDESYISEGVAVHNCSAPQYTKNSIHAGCVEIHVAKNARMRYSSVENWSRNTYNLNTKRAVVQEGGVIEWVGGNLGSGVTMLYPTSYLIGANSRADHLSIAYAGKKQNQDVGAKVYHVGPNTTSIIKSKSISKDGGITAYRGIVNVSKSAVNSKSKVVCDALMMDEKSVSNTFPFMHIKNNSTDVAHEATCGKISEEVVFYLMSRGLSEEQATKLVVSGFIEEITRELPMEYAVELNKLIEMEIEGSLG